MDNDQFATNQFLHPYQGATYQGFARSAGLGFWESAAYTLGGSLLWEEAGQSTYPSINDQVASGIDGLFLGEPLFLSEPVARKQYDRHSQPLARAGRGGQLAVDRHQPTGVRRALRRCVSQLTTRPCSRGWTSVPA